MVTSLAGLRTALWDVRSRSTGSTGGAGTAHGRKGRPGGGWMAGSWWIGCQRSWCLLGSAIGVGSRRLKYPAEPGQAFSRHAIRIAGPSGAPHPRRTRSLSSRGARGSPRIRGPRLSAAEARLMGRRSTAGSSSPQDPARGARPEDVAPAFRRTWLASRGGPSTPKSRPHPIRGQPLASRRGRATPDRRNGASARSRATLREVAASAYRHSRRASSTR